MNEQEARRSLKAHMSAAEIDIAIAALFDKKPQKPVTRRRKPQDDKLLQRPWFEDQYDDNMREGSARLYKAVRDAYDEIPHGPIPKSAPVRSMPTKHIGPCWRCGAARGCACA